MKDKFNNARDEALGSRVERDQHQPSKLIPKKKKATTTAGAGVYYERNKYAKSVNKEGVRCYTLGTSSEPLTNIVAPCASGKLKASNMELPVPLAIRRRLVSVSSPTLACRSC